MSTKNTSALFDAPAPAAPSGSGPVELAVQKEIERKIADGILDAALFAGQIAQLLAAARELDESRGVGRPSGRAQFHDVVHRMLMDLPQPEKAAPSSDLDRVLEAIMEMEE